MNIDLNFLHVNLRMVDLDRFFQGMSLADLSACEARTRAAGWGLAICRVQGTVIVEEFPWNHQTRLMCKADGNIRFQFFKSSEKLAHLMQRAGIFASVSEARRNGWDKPVPPGYSAYEVGKRRARITVLNE